MSKETIKAILNEFKIINGDILIRSKINEDQLIDSIEANKKYMPGLLVINKIDSVSDKKLKQVQKKYSDAVFISADKGDNLDKLKQIIFDKLKLMRIYLKQPGKEPDMEEPLIMKKGELLEDLCNKLHRGFVNRFRFSRVWGKSARYDGQKIVNLKHKLKDKDVVELRLR
jgi:ribosome-interacting GTPase 1